MVEVAAKDAKSQFDSLLDRASHGEVIVITREGRPIAEITPVRSASATTARRTDETDEEREARLDAALAAISRLRQQYAVRGLTYEEIRAWIDEGRP